MSKLSVVQYVKQLDDETGVVTEETRVVNTYDNPNSAFTKMNEIKAYFWNTPNVYRATVKVFDENLVEYKEPTEITHPEPEPEPEENEEATEG